MSDAEQRRLMEIEFSLRAEDPEFVHRFEARIRRRRLRRVASALVLATAAVATVVALASGSVLGAVVALTVVGVVIGLWLTAAVRRRES